jgi:hypothetical protein
MDGEAGYQGQHRSRDVRHFPWLLRLPRFWLKERISGNTQPILSTERRGPCEGVCVNWAGNHKKNLRISVEASLRKLRTDYIDILYLHWWDHSTSIEELMQSLDALVKSGKVLYLGISDTPGERFVPTCSQSWADQVGQLGWCRKRTSMLAAKAWLNSSSKMSHTSRIMRPC